jgi:serine/threonine protein kinase
MTKVARAVEYAHSRGVLHRDLKPGNILLDDRGEPLVSDFGLAKLLDGSSDLTRSVTTFGTAGFIAPEQVCDAAADVTPAADVYSLGAVLFNLLAGRPPFFGSNPISVIRKASETQAPKLRSVIASLDRDLETICARCLEREPKARYQSAGDLAAELERWLGGHPIVARPVSVPARAWRWSQRNPKLVGAATAGLLLGATAVWMFRGTPHPGNSFTNDLPSVVKDATHATGVTPVDRTAPVAAAFNPPSAPDYTSPADFGAGLNSQLAAAPPITESISPVPDRAAESGPIKDELGTHVALAPPDMSLSASVRDRSPEDRLATKKITADATAPAERMEPKTSGRDHSSEVALRAKTVTPAKTTSNSSGRAQSSDVAARTKKIAPEIIGAPQQTGSNSSTRDRSAEAALPRETMGSGPASIQGFVKDAKGEPIKGADLRIESRDGKRMFNTVRTDSKGRYISPRLQPGVYRVTLLVNGAVKASITNTRTSVNQPTQLNFDFKTSQTAGATPKARKHMVWVPNRTGSHIGGTWVEVDDKGNGHAESNMQTYTTRQ